MSDALLMLVIPGVLVLALTINVMALLGWLRRSTSHRRKTDA